MKITVVGRPEHKHIYLFSSSNERNMTVNVNHSLPNIFIFLYLVVCSWLFLCIFFLHSAGVSMRFNPADVNGPNSHFIFAAFQTIV